MYTAGSGSISSSLLYPFTHLLCIAQDTLARDPGMHESGRCQNERRLDSTIPESVDGEYLWRGSMLKSPSKA